MAFLPGFKKQFSKANQFMSERITGAEGTKMDNEFTEMEKQTDLFNEMTKDLSLKTKEYLQPNPTVRAKMAAVKGISKLSGQAKASTYPQPEGTLGEAMNTYGSKWQDFDNGSVFASALMESGESLKQMADLKYALDDSMKQNFLEPLHHTQTKDLKEVFYHRKKLQGRRLDFDCKKRTGASENKCKQAEDKFAESLNLAQMGMHNLLDSSNIEHISQLTQFAEALLNYHKNCMTIQQTLTDTLYEKINKTSMKPKSEFKPKTLEDLGVDCTRNYTLSAPDRNVHPGSPNSNLQVNSGGGNPSQLISPTHSQASSPTHGAWGGDPSPSPHHSPVTTPSQ